MVEKRKKPYGLYLFRKKIHCLYLFMCLVFFSLFHNLHAQEDGTGEIRSFFFGARSLAFGGAFVGLADSEEALYENPAGLANISGMQVHWLTWGSELSLELLTTALTQSSLLTSISTENLNLLIGRNIYGRTQIAPTFVTKDIGFGIFLDQQLALYSKNRALPQFTLGYQTTIAIEVGMAHSFWNHKRSRRAKVKKVRRDLSVGVTGKIVSRRGGYQLLTMSKVLSLPSEGRSGLSSIVGGYGTALGVDLGVQALFPLSNRSVFRIGAAFVNIGDLTFGGGASSEKQNLSAGISWSYWADFVNINFAYDYQSILRDLDWRVKNHAGLELKFPLVSVFGALHQVSLSYGVSFDVWLLKITAVRYTHEIGFFANQASDSRLVFEVDLKVSL